MIFLPTLYGGRSSIGRASVCGTEGSGFKSHRPPILKAVQYLSGFFYNVSTTKASPETGQKFV